MTYKPPKVDDYGPRGQAEVSTGVVDNKPMVQVTFVDNNAKYRVPRKNCPDYVQKGIFFVEMTPDRQGIRSMRPWNAPRIRGKVAKFHAKEGEKPTPKTVNVKNESGGYSYNYFGLTIEVTQPEKYAGMEIPFMPRYHFQSAQEEVNGKMEDVVAYSHMKSRYTGQLDEFLTLTGAWKSGPIPYSDNIVPTLQKRILRQGLEFEFSMKEGWLKDFVLPDVNEASDDWQKEPEPVVEEKKKKPAKVVEEEVTDFGEPVDEDDKSETESAPWEDVED